MPVMIADLIGVQLNASAEDAPGGWLQDDDAGGQQQLCPAGNDTDAVARLSSPKNVYVQRRVFINVYAVVGLCAFGFVGNALTVAVLRRDKVSARLSYCRARLPTRRGVTVTRWVECAQPCSTS